MKNKVLFLTVAVLIIIAIGGYSFPKGETVVEKLGASSGPEHFDRQSFRSGSTDGGRVATTSPEGATAYTTASKDFNGTPTYIDWLPNNNITVSISGTSTHQYIPNIGDVATVYLRNASTTAASTITLAAVDGGVDLQYTEATGGDLVLNGLDFGSLTLIRESANLVTVLFNEFTEAD